MIPITNFADMNDGLKIRRAAELGRRFKEDLEHALGEKDLGTLSRLVSFVNTINGHDKESTLINDLSKRFVNIIKGELNKLERRLREARSLLQEWMDNLKAGDYLDIIVPLEYKWYRARIVERNGDLVSINYPSFRATYIEVISLSDPKQNCSPPGSRTAKEKANNWYPKFYQHQLDKEAAKRAEELAAAQHAEEEEKKDWRKNYRCRKQGEEGGEDEGKKQSDEVDEAKKKKMKVGAATGDVSDDVADDNDWLCAICNMFERDCDNDNDLSGDLCLCDGPCMRSFHVGCLNMEKLPEGDEWFCADCVSGCHECFLCKKKGKDYEKVFRCSFDLCGRYYHKECLDQINTDVDAMEAKINALPSGAECTPTTSLTWARVNYKKIKDTVPVIQGRTPSHLKFFTLHNVTPGTDVKEEKKKLLARSDVSIQTVDTLKFRCGHHYCAVCHNFHMQFPKDYNRKVNWKNGSGQELFECLACPKAYHINCIPFGSRYNSMCLICPDHPERTLPSKEAGQAFRVDLSAKNLLSVCPMPDEEPDVNDINEHHFKLPLWVRDDVRAEAQSGQPEFRKISRLDFTSLPGGKAASPFHSQNQRCVCENQCDENCLNRVLKIECCGNSANDKVKLKGKDDEENMGSNCNVGPGCGNRDFSGKEWSKIVRFKEHAMGWGCKAGQDIKEGDLVIEYVGEVIDTVSVKKRTEDQRKFHPDDHDFYIMELDTGIFVDGKFKGSESRFINHSCDPNCLLERWVVNGRARIGIFALRDIEEGEPLSYDYQFDTMEASHFKCFCGALNCRGTMAPNLEGKKTSSQLTERERKRLIAQGQQREQETVYGHLKAFMKNSKFQNIKDPAKQLDLMRAEGRLTDDSHITKFLPGDGIFELHKGPQRLAVRSAQLVKVSLARNVEATVDMGWAKRRMLHLAARVKPDSVVLENGET